MQLSPLPLYPCLGIGIKINTNKLLQILAALFPCFVHYKCQMLERGSVVNHPLFLYLIKFLN